MNDAEKKELIELLNKNWMTHDGMWFYHCLQEMGIEKANKLNKLAISALAPIEIKRLINFLGIETGSIKTFDSFQRFFESAKEMFIPDFMNTMMNFPEENLMRWEFKPYNCFAYKGMVAADVIEHYECGVIYRIECWINSLGIKYSVKPKISKCLMLTDGNCTGDILFDF
ncbi:MAG: hypothetical protein JRG81_06750 [Deltaproteobacteria bacterium]|nr:hypothetical protein [Deltaproteobacteria bacterium]